MSFRRKPIRQRDIVSFGRRTPRFDLLAIRQLGYIEDKVADAANHDVCKIKNDKFDSYRKIATLGQ